MRRSKSEVYLHFVWTTIQRLPLVTPELEPLVYITIVHLAKQRGAEVFAVGGMPDHIHLVVKKPPTISESEFMKRVKGTSSTIIREEGAAEERLFRWQENYGVFSFHSQHLDSVCAYVQKKKSHHAANSDSVRSDFEEDYIEVQSAPAL